MTQAELLLLKLNTGHGPFKRHYLLPPVYDGPAEPNTWRKNNKAITGDPVLICMCHGYAFDSEKLVNEAGDWRKAARDLELE